MSGMIWLLVFLCVFGVLAFHRAAIAIWAISYALLLLIFSKFVLSTSIVIVAWLIYAAIFTPLGFKPLRRRLISQPLLDFYRKVMPTMSRTERDAISAGTITWEGDLFRGNPDWHKLIAMPHVTLSAEEQAFLDGPVEILCQMISDWEITHNLADLPPSLWQFMKDNGFFALIIPKEYGGKAFSAYAHSQIIIKVSGRSIAAATTIAVPNSLGPAELLLHYGTDAQKKYYLPRLATGAEIPCFALTSPTAGSDAGSMSDHGVVCYAEHEGQRTLGIRLQFDKRYITLAPVATVIGLAFKLYDPDQLLGDKKDIGITCALIPRHTAGISIGRRHFPLNSPFQNGPIHGKDVFIPLDWIIGGKEEAGHGWRMLMECLANGRAISLPATALGGAKVLAYATGAYARIRQQFNIAIGKFEGIEEPLARIGAYTYIMDAARSFAVASLDAGEHPAVASGIVKYHVTELGRQLACDGMDIHGGKGICLGPNNYLGRAYEASPIAITVEGANILTRCMIIFGQGAMRCHPYVLQELEAAQLSDKAAALRGFDKAVIKHIAFGVSNVVRSLVLAFTSSFIVQAPTSKFKRYFQHATRFASAFALIADVSMLSLGGELKRKESISGRLGDILSYLYLLSAVLKQYHEQGQLDEDKPVVQFAGEYCLFQIQERFAEIIDNFPNRFFAILLKAFIFPLGMPFKKTKDTLNREIAELLMSPTGTRDRLAKGAYLAADKENVLANVQDALLKTIAAEPIEKIIKEAKKAGKVSGYTDTEYVQSALDQGVITVAAFDQVMQAAAARMKVIAVDDFTSEELAKIPITQTKTTSYANADNNKQI